MTKRKIILGEQDGSPVSIDLAMLSEQRLLVQGASGSGKSGLLRRLLEQTYGQIPQVVIDVEGEFSTLRTEFPDYVLAAAEGGDVLAAPYTAAKLARWVNQHRANAILDVSELDIRERVEFVRVYLDTLVNLPRRLWKPVLLVIDEAHEFAPEGSSSESLRAVERAALRGRKRGIILVVATPRIAKLSKSVTSMMLNKLIGKTQEGVDVQRAAFELGVSAREGAAALRSLKSRNFIGYGGAFRLKGHDEGDNLSLYVQDTATHPPKSGELVKPRTPTAKMRAALAGLNELPKEAQQEVRDLADARKEIDRLARELKAKPKPEVEVKRVVLEAPPCGHEATIKQLEKRGAALEARSARLEIEVRTLAESLREARDATAEALPRITTMLDQAGRRHVGRMKQVPGLPAAVAPVAPNVPARVLSEPKPTPVQNVPRNVPNGDPSADGLTRAQQHLLDSLAKLEAFRLHPAPQTTLCAIAGVPLNGNTYANLRAITGLGLVAKEGTAFAFTDAGRAAAHAGEPLRSTADLHDAWLANLAPPQQSILRYLIQLYPERVSKNGVADALGVPLNGNTYANIRRVKSIGAAVEIGKDLAASPLLFPEGLE